MVLGALVRCILLRREGSLASCCSLASRGIRHILGGAGSSLVAKRNLSVLHIRYPANPLHQEGMDPVHAQRRAAHRNLKSDFSESPESCEIIHEKDPCERKSARFST